MPPLLSKHAIRKSGGKPPFPTSTILLALVSHEALEFGTLIVTNSVCNFALPPTTASGCLDSDEITRAGLNRVLSSEDLLTRVANEHGAPR